MVLELGKPIRFLVLRWEDGWEFGCPVVVLEPVVRYFQNGQSMEEVLEEVCLDLAIDRERRIPLRRALSPGEQKEFAWRGWRVEELHRKAEQVLAGRQVVLSRAVRRGFVQAREFWVQFQRASAGEVHFEVVDS